MPYQVTYQDIIDILRKALEEIVKMQSGLHFNERYLHHYFSREIQKHIPISYSEDTQLHPEWATFRKSQVEYAKYLFNDRIQCYAPCDDGYSGFIDFAIGPLSNPTIAIEFKMSNSFDAKGVAYDYVKLLDSRNPFKIAISLVIVYGLKPNSRIDLKSKMEAAFKNAVAGLGNTQFASERKIHFIVVAIYAEVKCKVFDIQSSDGFIHTKEYKLDYQCNRALCPSPSSEFLRRHSITQSDVAECLL